jgi:hypothetical protein
LLGDDEQRLLARLGIFAADFDVEAAEAVADATIDDLQALVDKSLLKRANGRFVMLETLRSFAFERLGTEELEALRRRMFDFLLEELSRLPAPPRPTV